MKKTLQISNIIALAVTICINYMSTAGLINGKTIADLSDKYHTLFTPAGYAFSIWGIIYLMLVGFVIYQAIGLVRKIRDDAFILHIGWWFVVSCVANSLWVIAWLYECTGLSVLLMIVLLIALLKIIVNTNMERWDAPLKKIFFLWWPFCFYAGWITVAMIADTAAYLTKIGWNGFGASPTAWAIIMILIAGIINFWMIWSRNMREFALVGIWALSAIMVANWHRQEMIVWTAGIVSILLLITISIHAFQNRATSPVIKWQGKNKKK